MDLESKQQFPPSYLQMSADINPFLSLYVRSSLKFWSAQ